MSDLIKHRFQLLRNGVFQGKISLIKKYEYDLVVLRVESWLYGVRRLFGVCFGDELMMSGTLSRGHATVEESGGRSMPTKMAS